MMRFLARVILAGAVAVAATPLASGVSARFTGATIRVSEPTLARNSPNAW